ncbi:MAG: ABC transporter substrate-binding protein [Acholeplasmatales bacterium]|nr:ABC transporter substrate-binding protein [Acholeplasmatales bacterium]
MRKSLIVLSTLGAILALASCKKDDDSDDYKFSVVAPNGAPAACLADMDIDDDNNTYTYIAAETISAQFTAKTADFIIAPISAGAKLYKAGLSQYVFGGTVTWGNIFFASQQNISSLNDLKDKKITMFGDGSSNASAARYVLNQNNITFEEETPLATAQNTQTVLLSNENAVVLSAEPAITAAKAQKTIYSIDVQQEMKKLTNNSFAYTQAGLFINPDTIKNHKGVVNEFIEDLKESCDEVTTDLEETAQNCVTLGILPKLAIAKAALPKCNISFMNAKNSKSYVEFTASLNLSDFGGANPVNEFYFGL